MGFVFVPGMGTRGQNVADAQAMIDEAFVGRSPSGQNRHTRIFDYQGNDIVKNVGRFFRDLWTPRAFPTRRFRSLVQLLDEHVRSGQETYVYGMSHGGLLIHRALQVLGRRYPDRTLPFRVVTGGSVRFVPQRTRTYRVRSALNVVNDTDPILRVFHRSLWKRMASLPRDTVRSIRDKRGHVVRLWIRTVRDPDVRRSGALSHASYFSFEGPERHPIIDPSLIDPGASARVSPKDSGPIMARNHASRQRPSSKRTTPLRTTSPRIRSGTRSASSAVSKPSAQTRRVRSAPSRVSVGKKPQTPTSKPPRRYSQANESMHTKLRSHPLLERPVPAVLRRVRETDPAARVVPQFDSQHPTYDVPVYAGKRARSPTSPGPTRVPTYRTTLARSPGGSVRVRYVRRSPASTQKRRRTNAT